MTVKILLAGSQENAVLDKTVEDFEAEIFRAADADEMRHLCQEHDFALLILDETMPAINRHFQPLRLSPATTMLSIVPPEEKVAPPGTGQLGEYIDHLSLPLLPDLLRNKIHTLLHIHKLRQELFSCKDLLHDQRKKNNQWQQSLEQQNHYLTMLSIRDGLTGLFNRRHLGQVLNQEIERARVEKTDLALLLIDLDYFNETNRRSGQIFGDSILNEFSARLTQNSRDRDFCFRFGGSDFIVLLPEMDIREAREQAERLRLACCDKPYISGNHSRTVTVSIGIVTLLGNCPKNSDEFFTMADKAIFQAKSEGRNRVVAYTPHNGLQGGKIDTINLLQDTLHRILEKTKENSIASIQILAKNINDNQQDEHIDLATKYINLLCGRMGLSRTMLETFANAMTLYSCFRLLLHRELLAKKKKFSHDDRKVMNDLPYKLADLTQHFDYFANERDLLLCQGEHYDGSGFPEGLAGDEIPLASRIFSLANGLAAMHADRPHRKRLSPPEILNELLQGAGTQWDPSLVLLALDILGTEQEFSLDQEQLQHTRSLISEKICQISGQNH